jgi:hypothetical protein
MYCESGRRSRWASSVNASSVTGISLTLTTVNFSAYPVASFTMKHALLCSSMIQGGGKRRADGIGR